jgi:hypothetical protein
MRATIKAMVLITVATLGSGCVCEHWDGIGFIPVHVCVKDASTGRPVSGVLVSPVHGNFIDAAPGMTDRSGKAKVRVVEGIGGKRCGVYEKTDIGPSAMGLRFQKEGYAPLEMPLSDDDAPVHFTKIMGIGSSPSFRQAVSMQPIRSE